MREIKFRVWNGKCFLFGFVNRSGGNLVWDENFDPQLFTCLKDKNGKEIYEGDIVKDLVDGNITEVKWTNEGGAGFDPWAVSVPFAGRPSFINQETELEIIGNIWETPELLKI